MSEKKELVKAFELMDNADDLQILEEIKGLNPDKLVYSFGKDANYVEGLTKIGVQWAKGKLAEKNEIIRTDPDKMNINIDDDGCYVVVQAVRYKVDFKTGETIELDSALGAKRQPKKQKTRNGLIDDPFFFEKAVAKAERNAIRSFIPEKIIVDIIKYAKGKGKVEVITEPQITKQPVQEPEVSGMTIDNVSLFSSLHGGLKDKTGDSNADAFVKYAKHKAGITAGIETGTPEQIATVIQMLEKKLGE